MTPRCETERFVLRRFVDGDLDELAAMVADKEQMRFYPRPKTREEASAWLSRNLELYRDPGYGIWLIESRATSRFLGYCGIRPLALDGAAEVEIAWHVRKTCWGRGLATEAASGWTSADVRPYLEHALEVFGAARCMVGSDWPVVTLAGTMAQWFDAVCDVLAEKDREAVLCGTASAVYGIEP